MREQEEAVAARQVQVVVCSLAGQARGTGVHVARVGSKPMTRSECFATVSQAVGEEVGKSIMAQAFTITQRVWSKWDWWRSIRAKVEREEGGPWGVAYLVAARAIAYLCNGRPQVIALTLAQREVGKELRQDHGRKEYADNLVSRDSLERGGGRRDGAEVSIFDAIPAPPPVEPSASDMDQVARLYAVATPLEREVLDALSMKPRQGVYGGGVIAQAAEVLGTSEGAIHSARRRVRKRVGRVA